MIKFKTKTLGVCLGKISSDSRVFLAANLASLPLLVPRESDLLLI